MDEVFIFKAWLTKY